VHLRVIATAFAERLQANERCLYLNSPTMIAGLRSYLAATGTDVAGSVARKQLLLSSEQQTSQSGDFDVDATLAKLEGLLREAITDGYVGLFASGDMLWEFGSERNLDKLLTYEVRLENMLRENPGLHGICQYHRDVLPASVVRAALYTHQTVYLNDTLARINPHYWEPATLGARAVSEMLSQLS